VGTDDAKRPLGRRLVRSMSASWLHQRAQVSRLREIVSRRSRIRSMPQNCRLS
jgi:hypothetical protein